MNASRQVHNRAFHPPGQPGKTDLPGIIFIFYR